MKIFYSLFLFISSLIFSQASVIKGTTIEETNGEPEPGVLITVKNIKFSAVSELDGNFIIRNLPKSKKL